MLTSRQEEGIKYITARVVLDKITASEFENGLAILKTLPDFINKEYTVQSVIDLYLDPVARHDHAIPWPGPFIELLPPGEQDEKTEKLLLGLLEYALRCWPVPKFFDAITSRLTDEKVWQVSRKNIEDGINGPLERIKWLFKIAGIPDLSDYIEKIRNAIIRKGDLKGLVELAKAQPFSNEDIVHALIYFVEDQPSLLAECRKNSRLYKQMLAVLPENESDRTIVLFDTAVKIVKSVDEDLGHGVDLPCVGNLRDAWRFAELIKEDTVKGCIQRTIYEAALRYGDRFLVRASNPRWISIPPESWLDEKELVDLINAQIDGYARYRKSEIYSLSNIMQTVRLLRKDIRKRAYESIAFHLWNRNVIIAVRFACYHHISPDVLARQDGIGYASIPTLTEAMSLPDDYRPVVLKAMLTTAIQGGKVADAEELAGRLGRELTQDELFKVLNKSCVQGSDKEIEVAYWRFMGKIMDGLPAPET